MYYRNFDIRIGPRSETGYPLNSEFDDGSEAEGDLALDPLASDTRQALERLLNEETDAQFLIQFGTELYEKLFSGDIYDHFQQCYAKCQADGSGIRLRLRVRPPEIRAIPWEFLYYPKRRYFISTRTISPLVRYLPLDEPIPDLKTEFPVRILAAIPGYAHSYMQLDMEQEKENFKRAIGDEKLIEIDYLEKNVTLSSIDDMLADKEYHCFHYIGHGDFLDGKGCLALNSKHGGIELIDDEQFADTFVNYDQMKLVVLNSCKGAQLSPDNPLAGMAPRLVNRGIPAVVAMNYDIYDTAALFFTRRFYGSLFQGKNKGCVDYAISTGRFKLSRDFPGQRELGTPVLYLRSKNGVLFDLVGAGPLQDLMISGVRERESLAQYDQNAEIYEEKRASGRLSEEEENAAKKNEEQKTELQHRIKLRNRVIVSTSVVLMLVFFLSWISFFDIFSLDTKVESYSIWLGDKFVDKSFSDRIVMVPITQKTRQAVGKEFNKSWREQHAILIDKLSRAGAKVIVFSMSFEETSAVDRPFTDAMAQAKKRETAVVLGYENIRQDATDPVWQLRDAATSSGFACIGKKLGYATLAPLLVAKEGQGLVPSLNLVTILADRGLKNITGVDWASRHIRLPEAITGAPGKLDFSEQTVVRKDQADCLAIKQRDAVADLFLDFVPLDASRYYPYEDLIDPGSDLSGRFKGKIVVVGVQEPIARGPQGKEYSSLELRAIAVNTAINGVAIQSLSVLAQFVIMALMAAIGALVPYFVPQSNARLRIGLLAAVIILYLVAAVLTYTHHRALLNTVYHIVALLLAYVASSAIRRRWFDRGAF